jgi:protein-tyrosine phosphatase
MKQVTAGGRGELRLEGVQNFRDLGGTPVGDGRRIREGVLYRSGHFGNASVADHRALAGLRVRFIDLRQPWEAEIEDDTGPPKQDGAQPGLRAGADGEADAALWSAIRCGRLDEAAAALSAHGAEQAMTRLYTTGIAGNPAPYAGFLASLAHAELPVVVHCSAGKDRTGWAVAVLLTALGAPEAAIHHDYTRSSLPHNQYIIRTSAGQVVPIDEPTRDLIGPLLQARPAYLAAAWAAAERIWGSRTSYLERGLGLSPRILAALRTRLLDDETAATSNSTFTSEKATHHARKH